ncbi:CDP-alcohol phosphatidyltransferase family protein [Paracoccus seriniphilus]|uniref:CDP-alcohol phosphatidyltransferase family protein n=1 Tax=Paracoccus seriniphilus TaxID=184748 RepID=UPI00356636CC
MAAPLDRRPLASRQTGWAAALTRALAATPITPNQISYLGMLAALIAGLCFWQTDGVHGAARIALLLAGAVFVQLRLLCNLLDGMVAIEAGRQAPDGAFWNEFPDRVADLLILMGVALAVGQPELGWAAVSMSFLTAYVRELGMRCGAGADYSGPMAKPHRMALITAAALLSVFAPLAGLSTQVLAAALWVVVLGAGLTALRRGVRLVRKLRGLDDR